MPRLTEASRRARREAIAAAAMRAFERRGVAHATTADIIEELGGSAGGVYSHFAGKADLIRFLAEQMLTERLEAIVPPSTEVRSPVTILRTALSAVAAAAPAEVLVQLWGEATVDPAMRTVVLETLDRIETSLRDAVLPWARTLPGDAHERADRTARAMRTITQGSIVQVALFKGSAADGYLDDLVGLLEIEED